MTESDNLTPSLPLAALLCNSAHLAVILDGGSTCYHAVGLFMTLEEGQRKHGGSRGGASNQVGGYLIGKRN